MDIDIITTAVQTVHLLLATRMLEGICVSGHVH